MKSNTKVKTDHTGICRAPQGARGLKFSFMAFTPYAIAGRAPQGARGLKFRIRNKKWVAESRAPQGARGLKSCIATLTQIPLGGRAPQGARGLKYQIPLQSMYKHHGRAPQGARGLKYPETIKRLHFLRVAPRKGRVG